MAAARVVRAFRAGLVAAVVAAAAPPAGVAFADEPSPAELAAARQLFNDGKDLEKRGAWADAMEKFKKVADVKLTPQVRYHIALCDENLGHLVAALNGFEQALDEARRAGTQAADVAENAPQRIDELHKRLPTIKLDSKEPLANAKVTLDGTAVAPALMGTDLPVDPGKHVIEVERGGQSVFHKEVALSERTSQRIDVSVQETTGPATPLVRTAPRPSATEEPAHPPASTKSPFVERWPAVAAAGVGVVAIGGAIVLFVMRQNTINDVRATCRGKTPDTGCDPALADTADKGRTYGVAGDVLAGVGIASFVAAGALWFALAPHKASTKGSTVFLGPTVGGVRAKATF